jgi:hypothetical protein
LEQDESQYEQFTDFKSLVWALSASHAKGDSVFLLGYFFFTFIGRHH